MAVQETLNPDKSRPRRGDPRTGVIVQNQRTCVFKMKWPIKSR